MDHLGLFGFEVCQTISGGPLELMGDLGQNFGETMRTLATAKHLGSEAVQLAVFKLLGEHVLERMPFGSEERGLILHQQNWQIPSWPLQSFAVAGPEQLRSISPHFEIPGFTWSRVSHRGSRHHRLPDPALEAPWHPAVFVAAAGCLQRQAGLIGIGDGIGGDASSTLMPSVHELPAEVLLKCLRLLGVPTAEAAPQQQPHYFFIQNPDGSRTQHFGIPPAEYQQAKGGEDRNHGLLVVEILSFI
ncbi:unnamed protein product [Cladocopium goreaui]|uniref:Uncharacterized protein n=1 Tax=Cladocopium goreaui TaxID=2562237 RepID=A0A9P1DBA0_9DINO|nr:unnamed protein product [Cladocopium goreaui]